ncbi:MAG: class I SAM-dependent methyltransferase [Thermosipho sp. (in: Bacteria)]|nr:class I SAM-dependent methyltransferase [Thermosipho sp. (in: thermotogales)]
MVYDYNEISKIYDDVREADLEVVKFIIEKAQVNEESCVLEIGCGTANYLKLIQELTQADVWGVDQSQGMLNKAKEKCKNAVFIEDDAVQLSRIPDTSFDLVYMVDVIHHIKDIDTMFQNIKRVLRENGLVIIFSDNHEHIRNRLTTKYFPETLEVELKRYQDTPEIIQSLSKEGFKQIDSGVLEIGKDYSYGPKLIEIASKKGYSMFGMISDTAIIEGIERIKKDMLQQPIVYHQRAPYVIAVK